MRPTEDSYVLYTHKREEEQTQLSQEGKQKLSGNNKICKSNKNVVLITNNYKLLKGRKITIRDPWSNIGYIQEMYTTNVMLKEQMLCIWVHHKKTNIRYNINQIPANSIEGSFKVQ